MATFVDLATPQEQALALAGHFDRLLKRKSTPKESEAESPKKTEEQQQQPQPTPSQESETSTPTTTEKAEESPSPETQQPKAPSEPQPAEVDSAFMTECRQLIEKKNFTELLEKLLATQLFFEGSDRDIETTFNLFLSLLHRAPASASSALYSSLLSTLTSSTSDRPLLRLKFLGSLYNILDPKFPARFDFFLAFLRYATDSGNADLLLPQFEKIDSHLSSSSSSWEGGALGAEKLRQVYQLQLSAIRSSKTFSLHRSNVAAHSMLVKYLSTFPEASLVDSLPSEVESLAIEAALGAIKLPEIVECEGLLGIPAIARLEISHPKLWQLLRLFVSESLDAFEKFVGENEKFLESVGLVYEDCLQKMRLLSLASLAAETSTEENKLAYAVIAQRLRIEEDQVEGWVIRAISAGIISAKLDQLRRVAVITRATQRVFGKPQWEMLRVKLQGWRESVRQMEEVVGKTQARSPKI